EHISRFNLIVNTFDSFTEYSRSGKGMHVWVEGKIGRGVKRDDVEIYSQERFIICTGNTARARPIVEHQKLLDGMKRQMTGVQPDYALEEIPQDVDDWYILKTLNKASNAEKFFKLWRGDWQYDFPSQSEADMAFMSMLAF